MTIKLFPPVGCSACSFGGTSYEAEEDGTVTVPHAAFEHLSAHGFTVEAPTEASVDEAAIAPTGAAPAGAPAKAPKAPRAKK